MIKSKICIQKGRRKNPANKTSYFIRNFQPAKQRGEAQVLPNHGQRTRQAVDARAASPSQYAKKCQAQQVSLKYLQKLSVLQKQYISNLERDISELHEEDKSAARLMELEGKEMGGLAGARQLQSHKSNDLATLITPLTNTHIRE